MLLNVVYYNLPDQLCHVHYYNLLHETFLFHIVMIPAPYSQDTSVSMILFIQVQDSMISCEHQLVPHCRLRPLLFANALSVT